jgi:hypothetical protein
MKETAGLERPAASFSQSWLLAEIAWQFVERHPSAEDVAG